MSSRAGQRARNEMQCFEYNDVSEAKLHLLLMCFFHFHHGMNSAHLYEIIIYYFSFAIELVQFSSFFCHDIKIEMEFSTGSTIKLSFRLSN